MFKEYTAMVDSEESGYLRSLMDFDYPEQGVPLEEVESVDSIVKTIQNRCDVLRFYFPGGT